MTTRQCEGCGKWLTATGRRGVWRYCRPCYERNKHLRALLEPLRVAMLDVAPDPGAPRLG